MLMFDPQDVACGPMRASSGEPDWPFAAICASLPCGLLIHDVSGRVTYANQAAAQCLGAGRDGIVGRPMFALARQILRDDGTEMALDRQPVVRALRDRIAVRSEIVGVRHGSGTVRWLQVDAVPVQVAEGDPCQVVTSLVDVTDRIREHAAARQAHVALRDEAARLNAIVGTQLAVGALAPNADAAMALIVQRAERITRASGAAVEVREDDALMLRVATGPARNYLGARQPIAATIAGECVRTGQVISCEDIAHDPRAERDVSRTLGMRSVVLVPLQDERGTFGVLRVFSETTHAFDERDVQTLLLMADMLAAAMSRAVAFEDYRSLVADRTAALESLRRSEHRLRSMVEQAPIGACIVDHAGAFELVNDAYCALFGYRRHELLGMPSQHVMQPHPAPLEAPQVEWGAETPASTCEFEAMSRDGRRITLLASTVCFTGVEGRAYRASFVLDITERKRIEHSLTHAAHHDALTGLPNRVLFHDRLTQALLSAERHHTPLALLLVDLDRFKVVNDTMGHMAGDRLLQGIATRLHAVVRASDTVARLGGDEFAVLLPQADEEGAVTVARKLHEQICYPLNLDDVPVEVGASIGIAVSDDGRTEPDALLHRADVSMYVAKASVGGCVVYRPALESLRLAALPLPA